MPAETVTPKEIARDLEIDPKALRKFIREEYRANGVAFGHDTLPGQGGRYAFSETEANTLKAAYIANASKRRAPGTRQAATPIEAEELGDDEDFELLEDLEDVEEEPFGHEAEAVEEVTDSSDDDAAELEDNEAVEEVEGE